MKPEIDIILASGSPRRIELLTQVGLRARVIKPDVDETARAGESPAALVRRLARAKALQVVAQARGARLKPGALVIAADTIVVEPARKRILGKPRNAAEARRMARMLAGKTHSVYTGFCVARMGDREEDLFFRQKVVVSRVSMRPLGDREIRAYVATGEPMDKAGAYAAQGLGMGLIEKIHGSYTNVVGLPMAQLLEVLEKDFGLGLFDWE